VNHSRHVPRTLDFKGSKPPGARTKMYLIHVLGL
jgi:hypothetical protein